MEIRYLSEMAAVESLMNKGILERFEEHLDSYFASEEPDIVGLPSVAYFADKFNLSPNYFGNLIKSKTGKTAREYIQNKIIDIAKDKIFVEDKTVSEIAYELGFKYPQHFMRLFKNRVGYTPNEYRLMS